MSRKNTIVMPFDNLHHDSCETLAQIETCLKRSSQTTDLPAAAIVETIQCEGGINVARNEWLKGLAKLMHRYGVLLIIDDIQVGCGRTGKFFSFESAGIQPDIVCLSKSLSGYGLPLSLVLMKPHLDVWEPGEHSGTFRGNNLAFVTATEALSFWETYEFSYTIRQKSRWVRKRLEEIITPFDNQIQLRGLSMIFGVAFEKPALAKKVSRKAFESGLIIETVGFEDQVLKIMAPLNIDQIGLEIGLDILEKCIHTVLSRELVSLER